MSLAAHLIHRCAIKRATTSTDDHNATVRSYTVLVATGVHCRLISASQDVATDAGAELTVQTSYRLLLPAGTDLRHGDQVEDVVYEDGKLEPGPFRVGEIYTRRSHTAHHLMAALSRVGV